MVGFRPIGSYMGIASVVKKYNCAGTITQGDLVKFDGSTGEIVVDTAGADAAIGVALESGTSSSSIKVNITPGLLVIAGNDNVGATFSAADVGKKVDLIGATGAMYVDTSNFGSGNQLECVAYNPQGVGFNTDTTVGIFKVLGLLD